MKYFKLLIVSLSLFSFTSNAALKTEEVSYKHDSVNMKGFIAYDDSISGKRPGVIIVHEWWGHTDYTRDRAIMLAELGYTAISLDMYGDGKTADHPKDAKSFAMEAKQNMDVAQARFEAGMNVLKIIIPSILLKYQHWAIVLAEVLFLTCLDGALNLTLQVFFMVV